MAICKRCGEEYNCPAPEVKNPGGITEIATTEWCAACNEYAMHVLYRGRSAYRSPRVLSKDIIT